MRDLDWRSFEILVVDDEEDNLDAFRFAFRKSFSLHYALGGEEGLELLERLDAAVVVSDQRMPGMSGVDFLKKAKERRPDAVGILLTAYTDLPVLIDALNSGAVERYIQKPWDSEGAHDHPPAGHLGLRHGAGEPAAPRAARAVRGLPRARAARPDRLRPDRRAEPRHAGARRAHRARRADLVAGAHRGRAGLREGGGGARPPRGLAPRGAPLRQGDLRRVPRRRARARALRVEARRRWSRRRGLRRPRRPLRAGPPRHDLPGGPGRALPVAPGPPPARAHRWRGGAHRRDGGHPRRRAHRALPHVLDRGRLARRAATCSPSWSRASPCSPCGCPPCASASATSACSRSIFSASTRSATRGRRPRSRPTRWPGSRRTAGPATCASWRT